MKQKNSPAENEIIAAEEAEDSSKGGEAFQKILLFMITVFLSTVAAYLYGRSWMELIGTAVLSACGAGMILFSIEKSRVYSCFYMIMNGIYGVLRCYTAFFFWQHCSVHCFQRQDGRILLFS